MISYSAPIIETTVIVTTEVVKKRRSPAGNRSPKLTCRGHCLIDIPKIPGRKIKKRLRMDDYLYDGWRFCRTCEVGIPEEKEGNFCFCCNRKLQNMSGMMKDREYVVIRY